MKICWELEDGVWKMGVGRLVGDNLGGLIVFDFDFREKLNGFDVKENNLEQQATILPLTSK